MSKTIKLFIYDNLMSKELLEKEYPNAKFLFLAKLFGFVRVFNVKNEEITLPNLEKSEINQYVNGICVEVSPDELDLDEKYELVQVEIQDFENENNISKAHFLRLKHFEADDFDFENEKQLRYLTNCINASVEYSEQFLFSFIETTYIGDSTVKELLQNKKLVL